MNKEYFDGTRFGFILVLIWLIILTGIIMHGKMVEDRDVTQPVLLPPPPLEVIEIELIGDIDYE